MSEDLLLKCLIAFIIGWMISRHMGKLVSGRGHNRVTYRIAWTIVIIQLDAPSAYRSVLKSVLAVFRKIPRTALVPGKRLKAGLIKRMFDKTHILKSS